jgi:hypothetical protein
MYACPVVADEGVEESSGDKGSDAVGCYFFLVDVEKCQDFMRFGRISLFPTIAVIQFCHLVSRIEKNTGHGRNQFSISFTAW